MSAVFKIFFSGVPEFWFRECNLYSYCRHHGLHTFIHHYVCPREVEGGHEEGGLEEEGHEKQLGVTERQATRNGQK